jgi:hypothetical protein
MEGREGREDREGYERQAGSKLRGGRVSPVSCGRQAIPNTGSERLPLPLSRRPGQGDEGEPLRPETRQSGASRWTSKQTTPSSLT